MKLVFAALLGAAAAATCDLSKLKMTLHSDTKCETQAGAKDKALSTYLADTAIAGTATVKAASDSKCISITPKDGTDVNYGAVCDKDGYTINKYGTNKDCSKDEAAFLAKKNGLTVLTKLILQLKEPM